MVETVSFPPTDDGSLFTAPARSNEMGTEGQVHLPGNTTRTNALDPMCGEGVSLLFSDSY
jgi:hypothetical protein